MIRIPSKTFLLGEYCVLAGGPALVLAHGPHFTAAAGYKEFHPDSPAGLLLGREGRRESFRFVDPHGGRGGFGGSGAEFVAAAARGRERFTESEAWELRERYREVASGSGVDVLVQAFAAGQSDQLVLVDLAGRRLESLPPRLGLEARLFHTGRKLPTHEHLRLLPPLPQLEPLVWEARSAQAVGDRASFSAAVRAFGRTLAEHRLLAAHSEEAVADAAALPGVAAAKGCGAMGSDVIALLVETGFVTPEDWRERHSLVEVASVAI